MSNASELAFYYSGLPDAELLAAHAEGRDAYQPAGWGALNDEVDRRGIVRASDDGPTAERVEQRSFRPPVDDTAACSDADEIKSDLHDANDAVEVPVLDFEMDGAKRQLRRGLYWLGAGVAMTAMTYVSAGDGPY